MATSIPPHNAGELCQALIALVENPKVQDRTIFKLVKGPDFPTGGIVVDDSATIQEAYRTGRGGFRLRARWRREEGARGTYQIVVDQIPYQVQKAKLIERIAQLIEEKKLTALEDVRDESTEDIRIVLVPKSRTVEPEILMEQLFRQTELESRISLNLNVLDKGVTPRVMSLREALEAFLEHRRDVLGRRTRHRLAHIRRSAGGSDGYLAVYLNLDKVIKIIRTQDEPKPKLMAAFKLTDRQAEAILNMRLRALRRLEEMQLREEHDALVKEQKELKRLLGSEKLQSEKTDRRNPGDRPAVRIENSARPVPRTEFPVCGGRAEFSIRTAGRSPGFLRSVSQTAISPSRKPLQFLLFLDEGIVLLAELHLSRRRNARSRILRIASA